jgi:hypothetical protein
MSLRLLLTASPYYGRERIALRKLLLAAVTKLVHTICDDDTRHVTGRNVVRPFGWVIADASEP